MSSINVYIHVSISKRVYIYLHIHVDTYTYQNIHIASEVEDAHVCVSVRVLCMRV